MRDVSCLFEYECLSLSKLAPRPLVFRCLEDGCLEEVSVHASCMHNPSIALQASSKYVAAHALHLATHMKNSMHLVLDSQPGHVSLL